MMSKNILIVDDSLTTRAVIRRTLALAGIPAGQCFEAPNGSAALELMARQPIDVVLADLHMPHMSGAEMAGRILSDPNTSHVAIVVISAEPNDRKLADLKAAGVRAFLRKPFAPEALKAVVEQVLGVARV